MNNLTEAQIERAAEIAFETRWWETHEKIVLTAQWMAENGESANSVAYLIEKPWKFSAEYVQAEAELAEEAAHALVAMESTMSVDTFLDGLMAGGSTNMVDDR